MAHFRTNEEEMKMNYESENIHLNVTSATPYVDSFLNVYIYIGLVGGAFLLGLCRTVLFFWICTSASVVLHNRMFSSIIRSPMTFFDNNPIGEYFDMFQLIIWWLLRGTAAFYRGIAWRCCLGPRSFVDHRTGSRKSEITCSSSSSYQVQAYLCQEFSSGGSLWQFLLEFPTARW